MTTLIVRNGDLTLQTTGVIQMDNDVVLIFDDGNLLMTGGSLNLTGDANLVYTGTTDSTGSELSLSSISSVMVNLDNASDRLWLSGDLLVSDMLTLQNGTLNANNYNLTIDGDFWASANGNLEMGDQSDLTISSNASLTGALWFKGGSDTVHNLIINIANDGQAQIMSDLSVMGQLNLMAGTMAIQNQNLALYGDFNGTAQAWLATNDQSNLWLMTTGTASGWLSFSDTANQLNDLMVDMSNDSIMLGSDVMINGMLTLNNGNIASGSNNIMLMGTASLQGGGPDSYIQTSGSGWLTWSLNAGDTRMYPVGTMDAFAGAMLELNGGSSSGNYSVRAMDHVYAQGIGGSEITATEPAVDKTWLVQTNASGNVDANLSLMWDAASEVNGFDNQNVYISHYTGGQWDADATASATANANGTFSITRNNIMSFSPFAVFDENTSVGIEEVRNNIDLTIHPNPAHDVLRVDMPVQKSLEGQLISVEGRVLAEFDLESGSNSVDITDLQPGTYFLRVEGNKNMYSFVKQ